MNRFSLFVSLLALLTPALASAHAPRPYVPTQAVQVWEPDDASTRDDDAVGVWVGVDLASGLLLTGEPLPDADGARTTLAMRTVHARSGLRADVEASLLLRADGLASFGPDAALDLSVGLTARVIETPFVDLLLGGEVSTRLRLGGPYDAALAFSGVTLSPAAILELRLTDSQRLDVKAQVPLLKVTDDGSGDEPRTDVPGVEGFGALSAQATYRLEVFSGFRLAAEVGVDWTRLSETEEQVATQVMFGAELAF